MILPHTTKFVENKLAMDKKISLAGYVDPSPILEHLRNNVETKPNMDIATLELIIQLSDIHVGFLFEPQGKKTLKILSSWVGAAALGKTYSNWKDLADYLELHRVQMQNIENYYQNKEGPVYYVLAVYAQWYKATLGKVVCALQYMGREDIISQINDSVHELVRYVRSNTNLEDSTPGILRPARIPEIPLILQTELLNSDKVYKLIDVTSNNQNDNEQDDSTSIDNISTTPFLIVMLTFANDGREAALRIAKLLRSHIPKVGVVILEEQMCHLLTKDLGFIDDCLKQVDAILPIVTEEYMDRINNCPVLEEEQSSFGSDPEHAKYIFDWLKEEYKHNHWKNQRVISILPGKRTLPVLNPVMRVWCRESVIIEECIDKLILLKWMRLKKH